MTVQSFGGVVSLIQSTNETTNFLGGVYFENSNFTSMSKSSSSLTKDVGGFGAYIVQTQANAYLYFEMSNCNVLLPDLGFVSNPSTAITSITDA